MAVEMVDGDLILSGEIGESFWDDDDGVTAAQVRAALIGSGDVTLRVNSGGGDAFEGAAIHAVLSAHRGRITAVVEGIAASAASLLVMAADEIVMAEGAMLMIHDPSSISIGVADDHRASAEMLDRIANEYAGVYARRADMSLDEAREVMRKETWLGGAEAVEMGFADRVEDRKAAAAARFDYTAYAHAPRKLIQLAKRKGWERDGRAPGKAAASVAPIKEADMAAEKKSADVSPNPTENPTMAATPAPVAPAAPPAPPAPTMSDDDRAVLRRAKMREAVVSRVGDRLTAKDVEDIVTASKDEAEAALKAVDLVHARMAEEIETGMRTPEMSRGGRAQVTSDESQRNVEARISALSNTIFGTPLEGPAAQFRGLTMKRLAMEASGREMHGHTDHERVKAGMFSRGVLMSGGMHSTSDFTYLTTEVMNRQLRAAYTSRPGTWRRISRQRTAVDFRTLYSVQAGVDTEMKKVNEHGEYQSTVLSDAGESFKVIRYGRTVLLTFEAVVNDDLSAFARLPMDFARGATNRESSVCWGLINANGNMSDGTAIFATTAARKNLAGSGAVISAATVGAARKAMWEQKVLGAKATGDDFISAIPNLLFVPPAIELAALQFTAQTTPDSDGNTNPFKATLDPVVEPRLGAAVSGGSDTAWYLFDSNLPTLEHAFLQGYESPMVESTEKSNPKGVEMIAEHIFGAGVVEFRGAYKNPGA